MTTMQVLTLWMNTSFKAFVHRTGKESLTSRRIQEGKTAYSSTQTRGLGRICNET